MSNRRVRTKRVLSDSEELIDLNDGLAQAIDVVSRNTEIPFGLPQVNVVSDTVALTGKTYICSPGDDNTITLTLQNVAVADQGKVVFVKNEYGADSYVDVYPQADDKTIDAETNISLAYDQAAIFMAKPDGNWTMFPFSVTTAASGGALGLHASTHQNGGTDEINVAGLSGQLADDQNPTNHASDHENGGGDEIDVTGLSGLLADGQTPIGHKTSHQAGGSDSIRLDDLGATLDTTDLDSSTAKHGLLRKLDGNSSHYLDGDGNWTTPAGIQDLDSYATFDWVADSYASFDWVADGYTSLDTFNNHNTRHENGGADEIDVTGLSGLLADDQNPTNHASDHQSGGGDAIKLDDLATPDDTTDLDATITEHGLLKKLDGNYVHYLDGNGNWTTPVPGSDGYLACATIFSTDGYNDDVATGTWIKIDDTTASWDSYNVHNIVVNDATLTIELDGYYFMTFTDTTFYELDSNPTAIVSRLAVKKNGSVLQEFNATGTGTVRWDSSGAHIIFFDAGDEITFEIFVGSGVPIPRLKVAGNGAGVRPAKGFHLHRVGSAGISDLFRGSPLAHASTHQSGGSDSIKLDDLESPDDTTDLDATITEHGLLKKLDGNSSHYLDGYGNWTTPAGGSGEDSYKAMVSADDTTQDYLEGKIIGDGLVDISVDDPGGDESLVVSVDLDGYEQAYLMGQNARQVRSTTGMTVENQWYNVDHESAFTSNATSNISATNEGVCTFSVSGMYSIHVHMSIKAPSVINTRWEISWMKGDGTVNNAGNMLYSNENISGASTWFHASGVLHEQMSATEDGYLVVRKTTGNTDTTFDHVFGNVHILRLGD